MSSMLRRIQKNIAKGQGYYRNKMTNLIHDSNNEPVGPHWPKVSAPTRKAK